MNKSPIEVTLHKHNPLKLQEATNTRLVQRHNRPMTSQAVYCSSYTPKICNKDVAYNDCTVRSPDPVRYIYKELPAKEQKPILKNAKVILSKVRCVKSNGTPQKDPYKSNINYDIFTANYQESKRKESEDTIVEMPKQDTEQNKTPPIRKKLNEIKQVMATSKSEFLSEEFYYSLMAQIGNIEQLVNKCNTIAYS